jgi:hypothetical protein
MLPIPRGGVTAMAFQNALISGSFPTLLLIIVPR